MIGSCAQTPFVTRHNPVQNPFITVPVQQDDDGGFMADELMNIANTVASNSHSCPAKLACWASRHSDHERLEIWQQIIGNKLLSAMLNTTAVEYAFVAGRNGIDCESFAPCPLTEEQFARLGRISPFYLGNLMRT